LAEHISRKDLKKDEFRESFAHGAEAILSHQTVLIYGLAALLVLALAGFTWWTYSQRQSAAAAIAFDSAMKTFQQPVGTPPVPGETSYPDDAKKFTAAAQQFADIAKKYPHSHAGQVAQYYQALSLEKLGENDDAKKVLAGLEPGSDDVAGMARFELAQLDDRTNQPDQAVALYQELIDRPTLLVPKPVAMLALANHYSQSNSSQAAKLYQQIKSQYPDTPIAEQADQALSLLPGKS
jgi:tetratricopeptide (TPR) repeat protein